MKQTKSAEIIENKGVKPHKMQSFYESVLGVPEPSCFSSEVTNNKGVTTPKTAVVFGLIFGLNQLQHKGEIHYFNGGYDDWAGARGWCEIPLSHLPAGAVSQRFCGIVGEWMSGYPLTEGMLDAPEGWGVVEAKLSPNQWLWVSEDRTEGCVMEKKFDRHGYELPRERPNYLSPLWLFQLFAGEVVE
jgi:hypothetical protein